MREWFKSWRASWRDFLRLLRGLPAPAPEVKGEAADLAPPPPPLPPIERIERMERFLPFLEKVLAGGSINGETRWPEITPRDQGRWIAPPLIPGGAYYPSGVVPVNPSEVRYIVNWKEYYRTDDATWREGLARHPTWDPDFQPLSSQRYLEEFPYVGSIGPIPGPPGPPIWTRLTRAFTMPAVNGTGTAEVENAVPFVGDMMLCYIEALGYLRVATVNIIGQELVLMNDVGAFGNAPPTTVAPVGSPTTPTGPAGPEMMWFTRLTRDLTMPDPPLGIVTAVVEDTRGFVAEQTAFVESLGFFRVVLVNAAQSALLLESLDYPENAPPATVAPVGSQVNPAGARGPVGPEGPIGPPAVATLVQPFTIPAVNGLGIAEVDLPGPFRAGITVFLSSGGYFQVVNQTPTQLQLFHPGYPETRPPGGIVAVGNTITASGPRGGQGIQGVPGVAPVTMLVAPFAVPPVGQTGIAIIADATPFLGVTRMYAELDRIGYFLVASVGIGQLVLFNQGSVFTLPPGEIAPAGTAVTGTGPEGPEGAAGPAGPPGQSTVLVGEFGRIRTPADLAVPPVRFGTIPIDWDGDRRPPVQYQMRIGESLIYHPDNALDPQYGHLFTYVSTATIADGWIDVGNITGPPGPGVAPGGTINQPLVKASGADFDTRWAGEVVFPWTAGASYVIGQKVGWDNLPFVVRLPIVAGPSPDYTTIQPAAASQGDYWNGPPNLTGWQNGNWMLLATMPSYGTYRFQMDAFATGADMSIIIDITTTFNSASMEVVSYARNPTQRMWSQFRLSAVSPGQANAVRLEGQIDFAGANPSFKIFCWGLARQMNSNQTAIPKPPTAQAANQGGTEYQVLTMPSFAGARGVKGDIVSSNGAFYKFSHATPTDINDGKIGARLFNPGLNIIGVATEATGEIGRQISMYGDVRLRGANDRFVAPRGVECTADNWGFQTAAGGWFYKKSGTGMVIRQSSGNQQPQIENNDGTNIRAILDANETTRVRRAGDEMTGGLRFGSAVASSAIDLTRHLALWGGATPTAGGFGFSIQSGVMNYVAAALNNIHDFYCGTTHVARLGNVELAMQGARDVRARAFHVSTDDSGIDFPGNTRLFKVAGTSLVFRAQPLQIENTDGTNRRPIIDQTSGDARYLLRSEGNITGDVGRAVTLWQQFQAHMTLGNFAGVGGNPPTLQANSNGIQNQNGAYTGTVYLPANDYLATGEPFYFIRYADLAVTINNARTSMPSNWSQAAGTVVVFAWNGGTIRWDFVAQVPLGQMPPQRKFNALGHSYTLPNTRGGNGDVLRTDANGAVSWTPGVELGTRLRQWTTGARYEIGDGVVYDNRTFRVTVLIPNAPATPDFSTIVPVGYGQSDYWHGPVTVTNWEAGNWVHIATVPAYGVYRLTISDLHVGNDTTIAFDITTSWNTATATLIGQSHQGTGSWSTLRLSTTGNGQPVRVELQVGIRSGTPDLKIIVTGEARGLIVNQVAIQKPPPALAGGATLGGDERARIPNLNLVALASSSGLGITRDGITVVAGNVRLRSSSNGADGGQVLIWQDQAGRNTGFIKTAQNDSITGDNHQGSLEFHANNGAGVQRVAYTRYGAAPRLALDQDPVNPEDVATKRYVDAVRANSIQPAVTQTILDSGAARMIVSTTMPLPRTGNSRLLAILHVSPSGPNGNYELAFREAATTGVEKRVYLYNPSSLNTIFGGATVCIPIDVSGNNPTVQIWATRLSGGNLIIMGSTGGAQASIVTIMDLGPR